MIKIFSKTKLITFAVIFFVLMLLLMYYKESTTNIEAPKRATLVYLDGIYE